MNIDLPGQSASVPVNTDGSFNLITLQADNNENRFSFIASNPTNSNELVRCLSIADVNNSRQGDPDWNDGVTITDIVLVRQAYLYMFDPLLYPERDVNGSETITVNDLVITRGIAIELLFFN